MDTNTSFNCIHSRFLALFGHTAADRQGRREYFGSSFSKNYILSKRKETQTETIAKY